MFLEALATYVVKHVQTDPSELCFVFPNRRSGLFFKRFLVRHADRTMWAPPVVTINELMADLAQMEIADPLDTIFELYDIYNNNSDHPEPFDSFYPWGEMMISDFDTLDKYLVNPDAIFRNIRELKEIDETFGGLEEEQVEFIRKFWKSFHQGDATREKEIFLSTWKLLPVLYHALTRALESRGEGYEGMLYRKVAESDMVALDSRLKYEHYFFAGFNALSASEKKVFRKLKKKGVASFFWDYDEHYMGNESMEAGRFLRENLREFPPPADLGIFRNLDTDLPVRIFDLPSDVLQAKTVNQLLQERSTPIEEANDTAIIACDENLLMPLLVSLPEQVDLVNITMGYPFSNTPLSSFVETILRLYKNARSTAGERTRFYNRDVLSVLNHQYYKLISASDPSADVKKIVFENRVYVEPGFFSDEFARSVFRPVNTAAELCYVLNELMMFILGRLQEEEGQRYQDLEKEYVLVMLSRLNKLRKVAAGRTEVELQTFILLFRKIMANQRIPFTGEPLAGLQVMGILETRLLDFDHVIMLSVNEEIMPASTAGNSFIPYSMRYAYGLPVREDMDAIYAYYFYRIIQRAKKVDLLFRSASEGVRSGEMSRYLYQMKYTFNSRVIRPVLSVSAAEKVAVHIPKTPVVMEHLAKYLEGESKGKYLSPSALNTYIECPLKFYFRKVTRVQEQEELLEELDPIGFGNILHHTIHDLYQAISAREKMINAEDLEKLTRGVMLDEALERNFITEFFKSGGKRQIEGRNLVILAILKKYLLKIIETDLAIAPVEIINLEQEYEMVVDIMTENGPCGVKVGGLVDRVDRPHGGITRIIDYKTGSSETGFDSISSLFDKERSNRSKEAFQAMVYATLYLHHHPGEPVMPGLYVVRKLFGEKYAPEFRIGEKRQKMPLLDFSTFAGEFMEHLTRLLEEIFDPSVPFEQTSVTERCKYCDFRGICNR
jgi:CRISPR/Cas system-associated exonuclease Cas4 (RecB family)